MIVFPNISTLFIGHRHRWARPNHPTFFFFLGGGGGGTLLLYYLDY